MFISLSSESRMEVWSRRLRRYLFACRSIYFLVIKLGSGCTSVFWYSWSPGRTLGARRFPLDAKPLKSIVSQPISIIKRFNAEKHSKSEILIRFITVEKKLELICTEQHSLKPIIESNLIDFL